MKNEDKEIIDLGSWDLPRGWDDVSLKMFSEIERYYSDKEKQFDIRDVLHIVCNKTFDDVNALPLSITEKLLEHLAWFTEQPQYGEPTSSLVINKEKYKIHFDRELRTGELVATDTIIKTDPHNLAGLLAVLCRKENEPYDSKFENEVLPERIKMFEEMPMTKVMPLIHFFMSSYVILKSCTQSYMMVKEALNHTAKAIETSQNLGVCKKWYLTWQINRLKKSLESINLTPTTSYSFSPTSSKKGKWRKKKNASRKIGEKH